MRKRDNVIATLTKYADYFKGLEDTENKTWNDEKNKWYKFISELSEGISGLSISDLDFEHLMDAVGFICSKRYDEYDQKYSEYESDAEKKNYDVPEDAGEAELMKIRIDILKDGAQSMRYFAIGNALHNLMLKLNADDESYESKFSKIIDIAENPDKYNDDDIVFESIYEESGDYKYYSEYQCSKKGAELLEGILGVLPEFDGLLR